MKSFIFALLIIVLFVFPHFLTFTIDTFQQQFFMKVTTEIPELVKAEGGISPLVKELTNKLERTGIQITYSQSDIVRFGDEIVIRYQYEYPNVKGMIQLETQNVVTIMKRE